MNLFKKLFKNKKGSGLVEKIMVTAFAVAAGGAVIMFTRNVIIESKNKPITGILDGNGNATASNQTLTPEEECYANGGGWDPTEEMCWIFSPVPPQPQNEEECQSQGGTWDDEYDYCVIVAAPAGPAAPAAP